MIEKINKYQIGFEVAKVMEYCKPGEVTQHSVRVEILPFLFKQVAYYGNRYTIDVQDTKIDSRGYLWIEVACAS